MNISKKYTIRESIYLSLLFIIFLLILTPGVFGEIFDSETWKAWSASRILIYNGEFVQLSFGPLYYLMLTILSPLNYKFSIYFEYFFSHLFFFLTSYYLFKNKNLQYFAIAFVLLSIFSIAFIQSPKYLVAASFFNLHILDQYRKSGSSVWFPRYLVCSFLCNWGYVIFFIAHVFVKLFLVYKKKKIIKFYRPNLLNIFFIILISLTVFLKADKFYNNHFVSNYNEKYIPIEMKSPFQIGFFQFGNYRFSKKNFDKENLYKADWYFTHKDIYEDCESVLCVALNNPKIIFNTITADAGYKLRSLSSIFFSKDITIINKNVFILFLISLTFFTYNGLKNFYQKNKSNVVYFYSILIGTLGYILALSLTNIGFRYSFALMPIGYIVLLYVDNVSKNFDLKIKNFKFFHVLILLTLSYFNFNHFFLNEKNHQFIKNDKTNVLTTNYIYSEKEVFSLLKDKEKIFSSDDNWISGFSNVNPKNVFGIFSLPPLKKNEALIFLDSFDIILLNNNIAKKKSSIATQSYLRYELYFKDFLLKTKKKWDIIDIKFYGKAYIKKN